MKSPTRRLRRSAPPALPSDEYKRRRRERRMDRTARLESEVRAWAERHGCTLRVLNSGQHWLFQRPGFTAEWWPSSAKLAVNRDYLRACHAPHWAEVSNVLETHLPTKAEGMNAAALLTIDRPRIPHE